MWLFQPKWMQYVFIFLTLLQKYVAQTQSSPVQLYDPSEFTGISQDCREALGANINCPQTIFNLQLNRGTEISSADIPDLCQKSCSDSIDIYLSSVSKACGTAMYQDSSNNYSTSYISLADYPVSRYKATCVRDRYEKSIKSNSPSADHSIVVENTAITSCTQRTLLWIPLVEPSRIIPTFYFLKIIWRIYFKSLSHAVNVDSLHYKPLSKTHGVMMILTLRISQA